MEFSVAAGEVGYNGLSWRNWLKMQPMNISQCLYSKMKSSAIFADHKV